MDGLGLWLQPLSWSGALIFPNVGVIVLYADLTLFCSQFLVQMAGRVGRTADLPDGLVLFVGSRTTAPMKKPRHDSRLQY